MNNSLLSRFFRYLRHPVYNTQSKRNFWRTILDISRLFAFLYFVSISCGILIFFVTTITNYDLDDNAVVDLIQTAPIFVAVLLAVVMAPITEELTFRLFLRFSYKKLALSISFLSIVLIDLIVSYVVPIIPEGFLSIGNFFEGLNGLNYFVFVSAIGIVSYFILKKVLKKDIAERFYKKNIGKLFYLSIIVFALIHITNYINLGGLILLTPVFVLPQFFAGTFLGYIRMNYGFVWSIFTHSAYNFLTISPFIIFALGSAELTKIVSSASADSDAILNLPQSDIILLAFVGFGAILIFLLFLALNLSLIVEYFIERSKSINHSI